MRVLRSFFKISETYIGIAAAIAFQLIFFTVWMTAYDGVTERTGNLKIAIVNEDAQIGKSMTEQLKAALPFQVEEQTSLEETKQAMDQREWHMVMHIPADFAAQVQTGSANLAFYINQSTSTLSRQMMESAAGTITDTINTKVHEMVQQQMGIQLPAKLVYHQVEKTNDVSGFAASMVPLMVVLASFVGAMIMSQNMQIAAGKLKSLFSKWSIFLARQGINLIVSLVLAGLTLVLISLFQIELQTGLFTAWIFQSLAFFTFLCLAQIFLILFGNLGMVFNIVAMATQLVSSGTIVPQEMLSGFYQSIGNFLPATHVAQGYYSMVYGGGDLTGNALPLIYMLGVFLLIAVGRIALERSAIQSMSSQGKRLAEQ